jgi:hypothetical protein
MTARTFFDGVAAADKSTHLDRSFFREVKIHERGGGHDHYLFVKTSVARAVGGRAGRISGWYFLLPEARLYYVAVEHEAAVVISARCQRGCCFHVLFASSSDGAPLLIPGDHFEHVVSSHRLMLWPKSGLGSAKRTDLSTREQFLVWSVFSPDPANFNARWSRIWADIEKTSFLAVLDALSLECKSQNQ